MTPGIRLLLVDGLNLIRRVYAAQPGEDGPERARAGCESSALSLQRALRETAPTHAVAVLEGSGPTWRHRLFPAYKAGHPPMPAALRAPLPAYRQAFQELGVATFELPGHEADDVTATLAVKVGATGGNAVILSTDKIFLQLLGDRIAVRDHFRKRDLDGAWVRARFGVGPESLLDLLALTGDGGSSIPGVPGIGPKTAAKLLASWGSLEGALAAAADPAGGGLTPRLAGALRAHAGAARLARSLLAPRTDLELGLNLRDLRVPG